MNDVQFYTILGVIWLVVTGMNLVVMVLDGKARFKDNLSRVLMPLLLFGAYMKIADLLVP